MTWATILSTLGDTHGIPSRVVEQILSNNISSFSQLNLHQYRNGITSNRQCDGWNEARSVNNLGMAELLITEPLGHSSKFYSGYKECNMRLPESGEASDWTANWNGDYASLAGGRKQMHKGFCHKREIHEVGNHSSAKVRVCEDMIMKPTVERQDMQELGRPPYR
ncbi:hypothetical protein SASPL_150444 [Salvia splendens]|uniref:Uncharacterized protein n=1 Tax=Salvia splendens TaxID=180675 RepID=A0A8X8Z1S1_SALSN|nr:hypothetical protein SASPL_150444 [Salvia splendens]